MVHQMTIESLEAWLAKFRERLVGRLVPYMVVADGDPGRLVVVADGDPGRLVVVGDVQSREIRILELRDVVKESEWSWSSRIWRGL